MGGRRGPAGDRLAGRGSHPLEIADFHVILVSRDMGTTDLQNLSDQLSSTKGETWNSTSDSKGTEPCSPPMAESRDGRC
jgi:hypothetical protein